MRWPCDPEPKAVVTTLKHAFYVEKHEVVAKMTRATTRDGNTNEAGTIEGVFGTTSLPNDLAKKNGASKGKGAKLQWTRGRVTFAFTEHQAFGAAQTKHR